MKIDDSERANQAALELLDEGDFYKAQALFRKNAKKHPGHLTLNNLGVYYVSEGMELSDGRRRSADKLGLKFLGNAQSYGRSPQNLMAQGGYYFKQEDYDTAMKYFSAADGLGNLYEAGNNLGACRYLVNDSGGARPYFDRAYELCGNTDDKATILVSYVFALLPYDRAKCLDFLNSERRGLSLYLPDEFVLLYLCGDLQGAFANVMRMINEYAVDPIVIAMVFDCMFRLGKYDEARAVLEIELENLQGFSFDMSPEIACIRSAYDSAETRAELIGEYKYRPPMILPSCYIGYGSHYMFQHIITTTREV